MLQEHSVDSSGVSPVLPIAVFRWCFKIFMAVFCGCCRILMGVFLRCIGSKDQIHPEPCRNRGEHQTEPSRSSPKNVVAIDCEMVRCVPDEKWLENARKCNKKRVAVAVRCAIVDYDLQVIYDEFISPPMDWQG